MNDQPKVTARASRLKFDLNKVFPLDDPFSVSLLRLMIAADDARYLRKLIVMAPATVNQDNKTESAIYEGEMGHLFRLLCGHLYEAGCAFRDLDRNFSSRLDTALANNKQAQEALANARDAYHPGEKEGFWHSFLQPIRNSIGFHYTPEKLRESFAKHKDSEVFQGSLALVEYTGLSRSTITDLLVKLVIADSVGMDLNKFFDDYPANMDRAIRLAGAVIDVVDHLLVYLFDLHPEAILEQDEDVITIPAWLHQSREETAKKKTEGDDDSETR